jgi:uncharacterized protein
MHGIVSARGSRNEQGKPVRLRVGAAPSAASPALPIAAMRPACCPCPLCRATLVVAALVVAALAPMFAAAASPSFDCRQPRGSVPALICRDDALAALDRKLMRTYAEARRHAPDERRPALRGEQRGWLKERDACGKTDVPRACVEASYTHRIAQLQARWRLVPVAGSARYACDDRPGDIVTATYFTTDPPTLVARRGDETALMFVAPSGSGARYEGPDEMLWEHQGEARIRWGAGAPEMQCVRK